MSKVSILVHVVINTYCRKMTISDSHKRELYKYIYGIITNRKCKLLRMNGIRNHIHMLIELNSTISLAELMQAIKQGSSRWLKSNPDFPNFEGWGKEYFAFSIAQDDCEEVVEYIKNQENHHYATSFDDELAVLSAQAGFSADDDAHA